MHRWSLAAIVLVTWARLAGAEPVIREQTSSQAPAAGIRELRVENARGRVEVSPSPDDRIHVTALKTVRGSGRDEIDRFSRDTRVEAGAEGTRYLVRVRYPQRQELHVGILDFLSGRFDLPRVDVRLTLAVPRGIVLTLLSTSGDLDTRDMAAAQHLESTSGDVRIEGAAGPADVHTSSGDVEARDTHRLAVHSTSGDVSLTHPAAGVDVQTSSGDVTITEVTDSVRVETVSGDVRVDGEPLGLKIEGVSGDIVVRGPASGAVRVRTTSGSVSVGLGRGLVRAGVESVSGDVVVKLAPDLGATLDAHTGSGTIDAVVPLRLARASRRALSGTVRNGGAPLEVRSVSGDIRVTQGGGD